MITIRDKIYEKINNTLRITNILFQTIQYIDIDNDDQFLYWDDKYVVLGCNDIKIINEQDQIKTIKTLNSLIREFRIKDFNLCSSLIIDDKFIFRCYEGGYLMVIFDLNLNKCDVLTINHPYSQILLLPNGKFMISVGRINNFSRRTSIHVEVFDEIKTGMKFLNTQYDMSCVSYAFFAIKNKSQIIRIKSNWCGCDDMEKNISKISILDLQLNKLYSINMRSYHIHFDCTSFTVCNNIMYFWDNKRILIIEDKHIEEIKNEYGIKIYNIRLNVFINYQRELFKIIGGKLTKYQHHYDLWKDIPPNDVSNVFYILLDLELLPAELYNIIYQEYIKLYIPKHFRHLYRYFF